MGTAALPPAQPTAQPADPVIVRVDAHGLARVGDDGWALDAGMNAALDVDLRTEG